MDQTTRGFLESMVDDFLKENVTYLQDVGWVQEQIHVSSAHDLLLGFLVGNLYIMLVSVLGLRKGSRRLTSEEHEVLRSILRRRLPEIADKATREINR